MLLSQTSFLTNKKTVMIVVRNDEVYALSLGVGDNLMKLDFSKPYRVSRECVVGADEVETVRKIFLTISSEYAHGEAINPKDKGIIYARIRAKFFSIEICLHMKATCLGHNDEETSFLAAFDLSPVFRNFDENTPKACYFIPAASQIYFINHDDGTLGNSMKTCRLHEYEKDILLLSMYGFTNMEIGDKLSRSEISIKKKKSELLEKFHSRNTLQATVSALLFEWTYLDE